MTDIEIGRLEIRLKGVSRQAAGDAVAGLGEELLRRLDDAGTAGDLRPGGAGRIDPGPIRCGRKASPAELRRAIAIEIARSVAAQQGREQGGDR